MNLAQWSAWMVRPFAERQGQGGWAMFQARGVNGLCFLAILENASLLPELPIYLTHTPSSTEERSSWSLWATGEDSKEIRGLWGARADPLA